MSITMSRGQAYIHRLNDERNVWLDGKRVQVTEHPAFQGTLQTIENLFNLADEQDARETLTYWDEQTGGYVHQAFQVPLSTQDISSRAAAFRLWSERTYGVMSRLSDYARSRLTGWYATRDDMASHDPMYADKITAYYQEAKRKDAFLTIVQRDPQINRSLPVGEDEDAMLRIVRTNSEGIVMRGAKMVATAAPYADDIIAYPIQRIPGHRPELAHMVIVAVGSPGLHLVCRESFAASPSDFAHPLSARYDEMDAVLFFDDVLVPWERVLLHNNPEAVWQIRCNTASSSLAYHQSIIRLHSKLEFITAVTSAIAKEIGVDSFLNVQEQLGEMISQMQTIEGLIIASEVQAKPDSYGNWLPSFKYIETARNLGSRYYPRAVEILKTIAAGGLIQIPSGQFGQDESVGTLMSKYLGGVTMQAPEKIRLFQLAWDLTGSPLGARHDLYERYYAGDPVRNRASQYVQHDKEYLNKKVKPWLHMK
ncbi:4-hydroxyphenylacetate 3-hydroxylase family protein [Paenibacillus xylanilyticus]|uniref:4-hydroxyphenylacetate 3-hydroxylase n=1 Tax=Paenibacillus xylanilyticus TaxID=248903 RepID=A0A7Y6EU26_9BACL|nr:4-hydroxyphenylacetate 3-hydroxylase N-terminal domain-containing protein [Paenibacillus xylanilyticus]NUU76627.1 4-hydroxyphenylacetate 3-hydroxylase [Paenibacillus xylanilyticus]